MQESFVLFDGNDHGTSLMLEYKIHPLKIRFLDRHVVLLDLVSRAFSHGSQGFSRPVPVMHFDDQIGDSIKIRASIILISRVQVQS